MSVTPTQNGHYQVFPFFTGTDAGCTNATYLLPPAFVYNTPTIFIVPWLYSGGANYQSYSAGNSDFYLQFNLQQGEPSQATVVASLALYGGSTGNLWNCAPKARAALMQNFMDLLQKIEQLELQQVLIPGATLRLAQAIADRLPAPFGETLFYRYSFSPGFAPGTSPYVDIRPGMRLRLETQASQFITPGGKLNGYVSSGRFSYLVSSAPAANGTRNVVFDPFLGSLNVPSVTGASTTPVVAGGLLDLQSTPGLCKYWRLIYPSSISSLFSQGDLNPNDNVTLIGAQTLADLNAATNAYPQCSNSSSVCVLFLGRALAIPEIPVRLTVGGQTTLEYVPLGTTIVNLVERFTAVPLDPAQQIVTVTRPTTASSSGPTASLGWYTTGLLALSPSLFDVPLIAGDNVTLNL